MSSVDIEKAIETAIEIVRDAHEQHKLSELTKAKVRQQVERTLGLGEGTLDEKPYKKRLKEVVDATVDQVKTEKAANGKTEARGKTKSSPAKPGSSSKKRKSTEGIEVKAKPPSSGKPPSRITGEGEDAGSRPAPKQKSKGNKGKEQNEPREMVKEDGEPADKAASSSPKRKSGPGSKALRSDDDDDEEKRSRISSASPSSSKKKGKRPAIPESEDENETESNVSPKKRRKSETKKAKTNEKPISDQAKNDSDASPEVEGKTTKGTQAQSDSELSVLIDEPPSKKRKEPKKSKKTKGDTEKKSRSKKESKESSPDEEQIKKLKSFVVACGVRKVWSKELKDCETPASQISHLRKLLTELGMKGRFSLEQAKSIKAKRDLEKEMADVQEFAQKFAEARPQRSGQKPSIVESSDDDGDDDEGGGPSRRPKNAHRSIMAFLQDQSDSE